MVNGCHAQMNTQQRVGWGGGGGGVIVKAFQRIQPLSLMRPCLISFRSFTLELLTALVWPCAEAWKALLVCR